MTYSQGLGPPFYRSFPLQGLYACRKNLKYTVQSILLGCSVGDERMWVESLQDRDAWGTRSRYLLDPNKLEVATPYMLVTLLGPTPV